MPLQYGKDHNLGQKFIMYGLEYPEYFEKNNQWRKEYEDLQKFIIGECKRHKTPEFIYHESRILVQQFAKSTASLKEIQSVLNNLANISSFYDANEIHEKNIDNLNFNLNISLLNDVFQSDPLKYSDQAMNSIAQLYGYYEKNDQLTGTNIVQLAKCAVFFDDIKQAVNILTPFAQQDTVLAYLMPLKYSHSSDNYYNQLIQLSSTMDQDIWCSMFFLKCMIPFQALDHKKLRDTFCSKCMESNALMLELKGGKKGITD